MSFCPHVGASELRLQSGGADRKAFKFEPCLSRHHSSSGYSQTVLLTIPTLTPTPAHALRLARPVRRPLLPCRPRRALRQCHRRPGYAPHQYAVRPRLQRHRHRLLRRNGHRTARLQCGSCSQSAQRRGYVQVDGTRHACSSARNLYHDRAPKMRCRQPAELVRDSDGSAVRHRDLRDPSRIPPASVCAAAMRKKQDRL